MGELRGRWWKLGTDEKAGHPYPTLDSSAPQRYEGVLGLLASAVTSRILDPGTNYRFFCLATIAFNGWVSAWLVHKLTRSYIASGLSIVLITLNAPTGMRILCHPSLFNYSWFIIEAWVFSCYLDRPTVMRGALLGVSAALTIQTSFYFAYFLGLALASVWLGLLVAGRLSRSHLLSALIAVFTAGSLACLFIFPVWTFGWKRAVQTRWAVRDPRELWLYGSELATYVWPPWLAPAWDRPMRYIAGSRPGSYEGWSYEWH
jgi:hypothetical protein